MIRAIQRSAALMTSRTMSSVYQAITTKFIGPTNFRGARINAKAAAGSLTVGYEHGLNISDNHAMAAQALAEKLGWEGEYFQGGLPDDLGFCFIRLGKGAGDREPVFTVTGAGNNHEDVCLDRARAAPTDQALSRSRRQMPNVIVCRRR